MSGWFNDRDEIVLDSGNKLQLESLDSSATVGGFLQQLKDDGFERVVLKEQAPAGDAFANQITLEGMTPIGMILEAE